MPSTGQAAANYGVCADRCLATPGCNAFSWLSGPENCYLKSTVGANKTSTAVWGGRVVQRPSSSTVLVSTVLVSPSPAAKRRRGGAVIW